MTTTYDTDPNTQTVAAAWVSSPLSQPERGVRHGLAPDTTGPVPTFEEPPIAKRVMLAAGLTCGIAAGALVGVMFFADSDSSQPTVVAPGPALQHAFLVTPSSPAASPKPVEPLPKPVVSAQHSAPAVVSPAPQTPAAPSLRPQGDTTGVVDIPIPDCPPLPPKPGQAPEP